MHHAELHLRGGQDGLYRFGEALQTVHARDEDVGDAPGDEGGERAVLFFNPLKSAAGHAAFVRLEGSVILTIESPSYQPILLTLP